jgi:cystathionine beta-lyase
VNPPVSRGSTVLYPDIAAMEAANRDADAVLYYGRKGTPVHWALREALTGLEVGAFDTMLAPSGVAAVVAAVLSVAKAGGHVLVPDSAYDPTSDFAATLLRDMGVEAEWYDPLIGAGIAGLLRGNTQAVLMESPGSLTFEVQDVPAICAAAKAAGVATILDATWATPLFLSPHVLGVDLVVHALTKYVAGHGDAMMGSVSATEEYWPRLRRAVWKLGYSVGADEAALVLRGLRTLPVRMARHEASGLAVARWLRDHKQVARVLHPALEGCPGHEFWRRDFRGASGLFSVVLHEGSRADAARLHDGLRHFGIGYSWGGFESLAIPISPERLRRVTRWPRDGGAAGLSFRVSVGLEDPEDLIEDLGAGLERLTRR